jgi:hypothetical protein
MVPTLAQIQRDTSWVWICCEGQGCGHQAPMALAPLMIRWGLAAVAGSLLGDAVKKRGPLI